MVSQTLASAILNQKGPDLVGSFREGQEFAKGQQVERLTGEALQAGGGQKLQELIGLDPEVGYSLGEAIGARSAKELNNFIRDASITENFFKQGNFDQGRQFIQQSRDTAAMSGMSTKIHDNLLNIYDNQGPQAALDNVQSFTAVLAKSKEQTSGNQDRSRLLADLESDNPEIAKSARIALKLESGSGTLTGGERIASDSVLGDAVVTQTTSESRGKESGKLDAQLSQKPEVEAAVTKAVDDTKFSSEVIKKSFDSIGKTRRSISNIDNAIKALDNGANTGALQRFLPTITAASVELQQVRGQMGLDVIGAVTFGALSESELAFALNVALPDGLSGPRLRQWLVDKKAAQEKVIGNMNEAIQFLSQGNTVADFVASKQGASNQSESIIEVDF
jgi:hypothetical protein